LSGVAQKTKECTMKTPHWVARDIYLWTGVSKNEENIMLSLGKKRWVEHFHDNHHRFSPVALFLIVQRRSGTYYLL